jgi:hypothetical protein
MDTMSGIGPVPSPTHSTSEFLAHENECRRLMKPLLTGLLDMAESAGWSRRTVASTLMFLAAQEVSTSSSTLGEAPERKKVAAVRTGEMQEDTS